MCSWIRKQVQDDGSLAFAAGSVPKQLVDSGLGAGLRVHPLDDDGAVEAGSGRAVGKRLAGKRARNHHCIARHRSEEHTSELQSLMRISYAVFCLKKKNKYDNKQNNIDIHLYV